MSSYHEGNPYLPRDFPQVFSSGCYTFADFPRVGFGIVIIVGIISVAGMECNSGSYCSLSN